MKHEGSGFGKAGEVAFACFFKLGDELGQTKLRKLSQEFVALRGDGLKRQRFFDFDAVAMVNFKAKLGFREVKDALDYLEKRSHLAESLRDKSPDDQNAQSEMLEILPTSLRQLGQSRRLAFETVERMQNAKMGKRVLWPGWEHRLLGGFGRRNTDD